MKVGPDLSHWQANVDLAAAKPSIDFVIFKATEGTSFLDSTFNTRWDKAQTLSIPRIAYHFAKPDADASAQATYFASKVGAAGSGGHWAVALDLEAPTSRSASSLWSWADTWIRQVRALLGRPVLFYTYPNYWSAVMGSPSSIPGGALGWWARYASSPDAPAVFGNPPPVWQCGDGVAGCIVSIPGIGKVDYNRMTDAAFSTLFGSGGDEIDRASVADIERLFVKYFGAAI